MTLADSIRKGAMQREQGFGASFSHGVGDTFRTCAMAAAVEGWYGSTDDPADRTKAFQAFLDAFKTELDRPQTCPVGCESLRPFHGRDLHTTVLHLNDHHGWTRERIADWLDSLEPQ